jgi:hypothetical protein
LGVDPKASTDEIRQAYRQLIRAVHPDTVGSAPLGSAVGGYGAAGDGRAPSGPRLDRDVTALAEAWKVLRDPISRAAYDQRLADPVASAAWIDQLDEDARYWRAPVAPIRRRRRRGVGVVAVLAVLMVIFVATAFLKSPSPQPDARTVGVDQELNASDCANVVSPWKDGAPELGAIEVVCTAPHNAVVMSKVALGGICPAPQEYFAVRGSTVGVCLLIDDPSVMHFSPDAQIPLGS